MNPLELILEQIRLDMLEEAIASLIIESRRFSAGFQAQAIELNARFERNENNLNDDEEYRRITFSAIELAQRMIAYTVAGEVVAASSDHLLNDNCYPFIDRIQFREFLKGQIHGNGAKMIFVKGEPKSGMSYLENYLIHLSAINELFSVVRINAAIDLDGPEPFKGVSLAKLLGIQLGLDLNLDLEENDHFKFTRFAIKLKEKLALHNQIPLIFIHDFHHFQATPDIAKFILKLADAFRQDFPKAIVIIAGMEYSALPNWSSLRMHCPVYTIEPINSENIRVCLDRIFDCFQARIFELGNSTITKEEYVNGMIGQLIPDGQNIDLPNVGYMISDHLMQLRTNS